VRPKSTFYRTANDPNAQPPRFFNPALLPSSDATKPLTIEVFGDYRSQGAGDIDGRNKMHGVFTRTTTVLATTLQRRLPDAVPVCTNSILTGPTYHQGLATDIPEDFRFPGGTVVKITIAIPAGARYVALCVPDTYYGDNDDPDDDLWIRFSR
jgi:hypothetical protein